MRDALYFNISFETDKIIDKLLVISWHYPGQVIPVVRVIFLLYTIMQFLAIKNWRGFFNTTD